MIIIAIFILPILPELLIYLGNLATSYASYPSYPRYQFNWVTLHKCMQLPNSMYPIILKICLLFGKINNKNHKLVKIIYKVLLPISDCHPKNTTYARQQTIDKRLFQKTIAVV